LGRLNLCDIPGIIQGKDEKSELLRDIIATGHWPLFKGYPIGHTIALAMECADAKRNAILKKFFSCRHAELPTVCLLTIKDLNRE